MFYANKCITFYSVLLQLATGAFGTKMTGAWIIKTDYDVVKVNELLNTQYMQVLHEILEKEAFSAFITEPAEAESMIYLEVEGKGKANRTAVLAMKGTQKEVAQSIESEENGASGGEGSGTNSESGGEGSAWFSIVLDYLNLEEGVNDSDRLRVAKDKFQNYTLVSSLIAAQNAAQTHVEDPGVTIEMRFQLLHAAQKKARRVSQRVQRALPFMKKSVDPKNGESSDNEVNSANPPLNAL